MDNKYYTPKIEEFHVGFEFEYLQKSKWEKELVERYDLSFIESSEYLLKTEQIRVKHLDQEDIESLGFKFHSKNNVNNFTFQNEKDSFFRITVSFGEPTIISAFHYSGWETPNFKIKNKSELDRLINQLDY